MTQIIDIPSPNQTLMCIERWVIFYGITDDQGTCAFIHTSHWKGLPTALIFAVSSVMGMRQAKLSNVETTVMSITILRWYVG